MDSTATHNPLRTLVVSPSAYRRWWYAEHLKTYGIEVVSAENGLDGLEGMRLLRPDIVLLEPGLFWGGCEGILAVRAEDAALRGIPVVLVAVDGVTAECYQLAHYRMQGLLTGRPSGQKLVETLLAAILDQGETTSEIAEFAIQD